MFIARFLIPVFFALCASMSAAQNPFATAIEVNEDIITNFELQQRQLFLSVISPANSSADFARSELIDDRLRMQTIRQFGFELAEEDLRAGMEEFAGRANLSADELIGALAQRGVAVETFREFVGTGLAWRDLIRARFGGRVQISDAEVDRAIAAASSGSGLRVLLSEIIMPAPPPRAAAVLARAERISQTRSEAQFSSFARQFSATASRGRGGRLEWTPITNLPAQLRPLILGLAPGEVTQPIPIPNAVALFQLRAIEETDAPDREYSAIEYAQYFIPGGRSEAAQAEAERVRNKVDVCDDLYGIAKDQPEDVLQRESKAPSEIPQDIALELAKLDRNEVSTALVSSDGQSLVFLMMCGRTADVGEDVSRDAIAARLRSERLAGLAETLLEQLRADARIREK
jgi:peptidyl-prolyl cis-trans isomerase SurA